MPDLSDPDRFHEFLVKNLATGAVESNMHATKGYIAFDVQTGTFCFLKDTWRTLRDDFPSKELRKYRELQPLNISGIASVRCGGDLLDQLTQTQEFPEAHEYYPLNHARTVFNEIGIPLEDYKHSYELCGALWSALQGQSYTLKVVYSIIMFVPAVHKQVWEEAGILHSNVNDKHIMLYEDPYARSDEEQTPKALLIDWHFCKRKEDIVRTRSLRRETRSVRG